MQLADAIRKANGDRKGTILKSGESIIIPGILSSPIVEKPVPVARDFEVRAVYLTGVMAGSEHGDRIVRRWRELGGNAVVFDIKDSDGIVNIAFEHPLATAQPLHLRSAKVHAIPAFRKHARHCARGHLPRRAPGNDASGTGRQVASNRRALA